MAADQVPDRLTFSYADEAEFQAFYALVAQRQDQGASRDGFWGVVIGSPIIVGLATLAALALGLIPSTAFKPVLATAYLAFIAGALAFWGLMAVRSRAVTQSVYRAGLDREVWEYAFDDAGFRCKTNTWEVRTPWSSVKGIEDAGAFVLLWFNNGQPFAIPSRLFADIATRNRFVAAIAARIAGSRPPAAA